MNDTQTQCVLVSDDYIYWGGSGPKLPRRLRNHGGFDLCAGRGHKNVLPDSLVQEFVKWIRSRDEHGYVAAPLDWS